MKFRVRMAIIIINIVTMFCGLLLFSVSAQDRMLLAKKLPLEKNKYKEVNELINRYMDAKKNEDFDELAKCVNDINNYDKESIKEENKIIKDIKNVTCYTIDGYYDNTYIVYIYREEVWDKIDVVLPSMTQVYVCEYKGKLCVYSKDIDSKKMNIIREYIDVTLNENPYVIAKKNEINAQIEEVRKSNKEYDELCKEVEKKRKIESGEATPEPTVEPTVAPTPVPESSLDPNKAVG